MALLREWWWTIAVLEALVKLMIVARVLLRGPRRSSSTLAWLLVLLLLPSVIGIAAWLFVGESRLGERRRRRYRDLVDRLAEDLGRQGPVAEHRADLPEYRDAVSLACAVGGTPPRRGNAVELMGDSDTVLRRLVEDIDAAQAHCHLLFYIWLDDGAGRMVAEALVRAVGRGVDCRVLLDDVGSRPFLRSAACSRLRAAGVRVVRALPASLIRVLFARVDLRNHRKLAVIDGGVGYTGSQNVADPTFAPKRRYAPWVDCMLRIEGPVVRDLQMLFVQDWYLDTGESQAEVLRIDPGELDGGIPVQVLPTGPSHDNEALEQLALASFHRAQEELILTTPYFVPGEAEVTSLCTAARRGVRVVLVLPARCDSLLVGAVSRSHFPRLLNAGVEVHEYQAGLLHAKTLTVDRRLALVTTANFDQRSFDLNYEVSTLVYDSDFASTLRFLQVEYMSDSLPVKASQLTGRGLIPRLIENAAGVFSPLL